MEKLNTDTKNENTILMVLLAWLLVGFPHAGLVTVVPAVVIINWGLYPAGIHSTFINSIIMGVSGVMCLILSIYLTRRVTKDKE